jgi:hypothetical protein
MRGPVGAVVTVGLLVGCGGAEVETVSHEGEDRQVHQLRICTSAYVQEFYSDPYYTQLIGTETCECDKFPVWSGSTSIYKKIIWHDDCL